MLKCPLSKQVNWKENCRCIFLCNCFVWKYMYSFILPIDVESSIIWVFPYLVKCISWLFRLILPIPIAGVATCHIWIVSKILEILKFLSFFFLAPSCVLRMLKIWGHPGKGYHGSCISSQQELPTRTLLSFLVSPAPVHHKK